MEHAASATTQPASTDPTQDRPGRTLPERLAGLLYVVRVLLGHGRRLVETVPNRATAVEFAIVAAVCGTYTVPSILARLQRGILRAMALERYLLARGEQGRDIAFVEPCERPPAKPARPPVEPQEGAATSGEAASEVPGREAKPGDDERAPKSGRRPFDPDDLRIPTIEELDAEVRRRPFGRTIAAICMDLAVIPSFCTGFFWNDLFETLRAYGGSLTVICKVRESRAISFQKERDKRPDTWDFAWKFPPPETVRQVFGYMIGEAAMLDAFGPRLATAPP